MALSFDFPLTNAKGLRKIILFKGLEIPIIVTPSLLGEPLLTVQPFYFIDNLDAVARVRFETQEDYDKTTVSNGIEDVVEYNLDNYLFEYSKKYPFEKMTTKIDRYVFWKNDLDNPYHMYDQTLSECLALDVLNDNSIKECMDYESGQDFVDWCLVKNFSDSVFDDYLEKMKDILRKQVVVQVENSEVLGTGKYTLPIIRVNSKLLTYYQALMFEVVSLRDFDEGKTYYEISRGLPSSSNFSVPQEIIEAFGYYNKELLAYYFSALKDLSPLSQFRNFYNVIEFFFEEAPRTMSMPSKNESQMIEAVFRWAVPEAELSKKLNTLPKDVLNSISSAQQTTSGEQIEGLNLGSSDLLKKFASRVYRIRNACMHSKKTRKGKPTPRYVPSMKEENLLRNEIQLLQWVATKVIDKDREL